MSNQYEVLGAAPKADDLKKLSDDRDSALAPARDYKIQPENQGKLVWLTGTPGSGKSTIGRSGGLRRAENHHP